MTSLRSLEMFDKLCLSVFISDFQVVYITIINCPLLLDWTLLCGTTERIKEGEMGTLKFVFRFNIISLKDLQFNPFIKT